MIDRLADRIERAYSLRRTRWWRGCSSRRVWSAAALCLWQAHANDPQMPLDSELYVASQPITGALADPWSELAQPEAVRRYQRQVRRIIRRLRSELKREVKLAERLIHEDQGISPDDLARNNRLSALGCYIAAQRAGRADLVCCFAATAAKQHRSCPLYGAATHTLLPGDLYPVDASDTTKITVTPRRSSHKTMFADQVCRYLEN
jgi:hypothetical protein